MNERRRPSFDRMRRVTFALLTSLALHAGIGAASLGWMAWRGLSLGRDIEVVPISLEKIEELPLGPPPRAAEAPPTEVSAPRARRRRSRGKAEVKGKGPDGGATDGPAIAGVPDGGQPAASGPDGSAPGKPGDLREYGPSGSRLTALLRLDRLRASPEARAYIDAVDEILRLLPDRRRLLDDTGLDLFRDFDALLIATPNPFDDTVTFLAARHRLADDALKAALDRGAAAGGQVIDWRREGGRPVGVRRLAQASEPSKPPDDRLFVLPTEGLAVIAPPAYARLLLEPSAASKDDAGARTRWTDLVARIDAEDGALPEDAVFAMNAVQLLQTAEGSGSLPTGLPESISLLAGTPPDPFLEVTAEFDREAKARAWQAEWPAWRRKLLGNPLVLLAGLNPLLSRATLEREGSVVILRTSATGEETRRLLQMIVNFARGGARR